MKKLILSLILAFSVCLSGLGSMPVKAESLTLGEDIEKELENVDLTPFEFAGKTDVITVSEVGFGTGDYKVIIYVYNAGKIKFSKGSPSNVVNLAVRFDDDLNAEVYSNFKLEYISSTSDESIYKFSVIDEYNTLKLLAEDLNAKYGKRRYNVAGIQLLAYSDRTATDYKIGKSYAFSGEDSTLTVNEFETIELEVHPVWYRTKTSDKGVNYQHQLNAVYFSVPNKYLENGMQLDAVKAEWYEYKTEPIIVIEDIEKFNELNSLKGVYIGKSNNDINTSLTAGHTTVGGSVSDSGLISPIHHYYDWCYNVPTTPWYSNDSYNCSYYSSRITYLFNDKADAIISSKRLTDYIYSYNSSADKGYLSIKNGKVSADLFQDSVDEGRTKGYNVATIYANQTYDLLSYSDTATFWDKVCDYGFLNTIFGANLPYGDKSITVEPIKKVENKDVEDVATIYNNLLIDTQLCNDFKSFYDNQKDKTTFLFRFAVTDYKSFPLDYYSGYVAEETVFLDFDVIHLEFFDGNERLVVPVVADPIDIIPSITPPPVWDNKWILYGIITILALLGVGCCYSIIKKGAN